MAALFLDDMITLQVNMNDQIVRLTLNEAVQFLPAYTHYLLVLTHEENSTTGNTKYQIPSLLLENQRITEIEISTIGLLIAGRYRYEVYGQNSSSNLDPDNPAVVGLAERGWMLLVDDQAYYDLPDINLSDDIIYG